MIGRLIVALVVLSGGLAVSVAAQKVSLETIESQGRKRMQGHDHWYYDLAPKINATAWEFLKDKKLADDPRYTQYSFK